MAYGASSAEDNPDDDSDLSHTRTAARHKKRPDDDDNLGHTRTAIGQEAQLKPDCHTEGRMIGSRTTSAYSFFRRT